MSRPLIISDCDEVLLHMAVHFRDWLAESEGVDFKMEARGFATALRWRESGKVLEPKEIWRLLGAFFDSEMHRQHPIAGAPEALAKLAEVADVVVLTNLEDHRREDRVRQLKNFGIDIPVYTNQGPKGPALRKIVDYHAPGQTIFIDDLPQHMQSVAEIMPQTTRLHFCGEPMIAPHIDCAYQAGHAHARIDSWNQALPWLLDEITGGVS